MLAYAYSKMNKKAGIHMNETMNLQDAILKEVRRDKVPVTLFLMNGFQLRGIITGFDSFVVVLVTLSLFWKAKGNSR